MPPPRPLILIVLAGLGLGAGARVWRAQERGPRPRGAGMGAAASLPSESLSSTGAARKAGADAAPRGAGEVRPAESVESILAAKGFEQAARLGRFLATAQPADLERLHRGMRHRNGVIKETLGDAIFLRWMSVDAAGGLAYARKEDSGSAAWWAWGKVDPDAALTAALEQKDPWRGSAVLRAIAQSDPLRARDLIERYPQFGDGNAMAGLAAGLMQVDPAAGATVAADWNHSINHENLVVVGHESLEKRRARF